MTAEPGKTYQHDPPSRCCGREPTTGLRRTLGNRRGFSAVALAKEEEYKQGATYPWDSVQIYFNGKLAAVNSVADGLLWIHLDHLGTPRIKTDSTGLVPLKLGVPDRDWYYPYGEQINAPLDAVTRRFTGQERDVESGLDYFGARHYSPSLGRFSSPDKPFLDQDRSDPQRWNLYTYARNNSLMFVDSNGEAIQFLGNKEEREQALQILKDSVGAAAAGQLSINEVTKDGATSYFLQISGDQGKFRGFGETANDLANLVQHKEIVEFMATSENLARFGGAVTYEKGEVNNENVRVLVNPRQASVATRKTSPDTVLGYMRWDGQTSRPRWVVNPFTPPIMAWHEFGHASALINGAKAMGPRTSVDWENRMRGLIYGPLGKSNAKRIKH